MAKKDIEKTVEDLQKQLDSLKSQVGNTTSPATKRTQKKYYETLHPFALRFKRNEEELYEHLNQQENKAKYIKSLIAKDLGYKNYEHFNGFTPTFSQLARWNEEKDLKQQTYDEKRRWSLKRLTKYINEHDIDKNEWKDIEKLFICDDESDITQVYCEAAFDGALPYEAWTTQFIIDKLNDKFIELDIPKTVKLSKIPDKKLKSFLVKSYLIDAKSKLDTNIDFYRYDVQGLFDYCKIEVNVSERYKELLTKNGAYNFTQQF